MEATDKVRRGDILEITHKAYQPGSLVMVMWNRGLDGKDRISVLPMCTLPEGVRPCERPGRYFGTIGLLREHFCYVRKVGRVKR